MSIDDGPKKSFIGNIWLIYGDKIVLAIGIILIAAVSFEAGFLQGSKKKQEPIAINKVATAEVAKNNECKTETRASDTDNYVADSKSATNEITAPATDNQKCAFVASKNSNKYHLPTCRYAQNIKPDNKICFSSKEEAGSRGYQGAKCCIK